MLRRLRECQDADEREKLRQLARMQLHREQRRALQENNFDAAAIALGLAKQAENVYV